MKIRSWSKNMEKKGKTFILTQKFLLVILLILCGNMRIFAEELFNKPVVEYFERRYENINTTEAFVGIDSNGDELADTFIYIQPLEHMLLRRLANAIKTTGVVVSYDDKNKIIYAELGAYIVGYRDVLEVGGKSVLEVFPGASEVIFPTEHARQARLRSQSHILGNGAIDYILVNAQPAIVPTRIRFAAYRN
jgi:hypothetical protein